MKTAIKAAGSIALFTPLPSPAVSDKDELERIIVMDHARWENVVEYRYIGKLTQREAQSIDIKERGYENKLSAERIEEILSEYDNIRKFHYFSNGEGRLITRRLIEPTSDELRDYEGFVNSFSGHHGINLIRKVYSEFTDKTDGFNYDFKGYESLSDPVYLHPAVLLSGKKEGVCFDKAFALSDIYLKLGLNAKIVTAYENGSSPLDNHAWSRLYLDGAKFDLDPTWYKEFTVLRRVGA